MKQTKIYTYGKHALEEALIHAPKAVLKVFVDHKQLDPELRKLIDRAGVPVAKLAEGMQKSDMRSGAAHQNVIGQISLHALVQQYEKCMSTLAVTQDTVLVLLSGVEDPHNFGAIIRSAAGFGAAAVLMPQKGQAPVSGAVLKVSAGMAFRIPLVTIADIPTTITDLKKRGFRVHVLAAGAKNIAEEPFVGPTVLILGNEGAGVPKNIRALADQTLSISMHARTESLNVAAAAAVALFSWSTRHPKALS